MKDEPIQIGLVVFDEKRNVTDTYQSLIKPKKDIKELKEIVAHITGFKISDMEQAPSMEEILPEIEKFFFPADGSPVVVT